MTDTVTTRPPGSISPLMNLYGFRSQLTGLLRAGDQTLCLCQADMVKLANALGGDGHAWLTISDAIGVEVVRASMYAGVLLVERGRDGTRARAFPAGSCVDARLTMAAVKDLMCNYDCCKGGPCGETFE